MEEIFSRAWSDVFDRINGPMSFRLIIQPIMAAILAIRSGMSDAKNNRPPFLWSLLFDKAQRQYMLAHGWRDISKVFFMAAVIDVGFQICVFKRFYPIETLIVAVSLSIIPYLLVRGPSNRLMQLVQRKKSGS
jgi:hypothetical protein